MCKKLDNIIDWSVTGRSFAHQTNKGRSGMLALMTVLLVALTYSCNTVDSDPPYRIGENKAVYQLITESTPEAGGWVDPSEGEYEDGTQVDIIAHPSDNWRFLRWEGDLDGESSSAQLTIVKDMRVSAHFIEREYPLLLSIEGNGWIEEEVIEALASSYTKGTQVRLTAHPASGWEFDSWSGVVEGDENPITLTIEEEVTLTAHFVADDTEDNGDGNGNGDDNGEDEDTDPEIVMYDLDILVEGGGEILSSPDQTQFEEGETVQLTAQAAEGWFFAGWVGDLSGDDNPVEFQMDSDKQVTAQFENLEYQLNMITNGSGDILLDPDAPYYHIGDDIQVTVQPDIGWRFVEWGGALSGIEKEKILTISGDETTIDVIAEFTEITHPLWAMGYNHNGQLGDGTTTSRSTPVQGIRGFFDVEEVAAGGWHSLIVSQDGALLGTGYNAYGQLGDGSTLQRVDPVDITTGVTKATANEFHSLIIKDGALWATGRNDYGQLGDGTTTTRLTFREIHPEVKMMAAGDYHSLFVTTTGELWGMGRNSHGQLGFERDVQDETLISNPDPIRIDHDHDIVHMAAGLGHSLFVDDQGDLYGIGNNLSGQLGLGAGTNDTDTPVLIASQVEFVTAGRDHTLYISNGDLYGMGNNENGQIGIGSTALSVYEPELIDSNVMFASAGLAFSVYVKQDGNLYGMGENGDGQLGDGSQSDQFTPVLIDEDDEVIRLSAGIRHTLFVKQ